MNTSLDYCLVTEYRERNFPLLLLKQTHITNLPKGPLSDVRRLYLEYGLEAFENGMLG
jgi:hypothetical protein